jgi:multidrug efflux pump subunit AcrA (membrane-fusion protein)
MASLGGFRAKAALTHQSPEQLDRRIKIVGPKHWLVLGSFIALLVGVGLWAGFSELPTAVSAGGFVTPSNGWSGVEAPLSGTVQTTDLAVGARVSKGQTLAVINGSASRRSEAVRATSAGYIAEMGVTPGAYVVAGDQLAIITPSSTALVVRAFFPLNSVQEISVNAEADIRVGALPSSQYGYVRGRVISVAPLPATTQDLQEILQNSALVADVEASGPVVEVVIEPEKATTASGLRWTVGHGPAFSVLNQYVY